MLAGAKSRLYLPDTQTGEVITDIVAIGYAGKRDTVLRSRYVCWWWDMIGKSAMLVKVDDDQASKRKRPLAIFEVEYCGIHYTHALSQYFEFLTESYRCLTNCSPAAMLLVGCIESIVQHSGLI